MVPNLGYVDILFVAMDTMPHRCLPGVSRYSTASRDGEEDGRIGIEGRQEAARTLWIIVVSR